MSEPVTKTLTLNCVQRVQKRESFHEWSGKRISRRVQRLQLGSQEGGRASTHPPIHPPSHPLPSPPSPWPPRRPPPGDNVGAAVRSQVRMRYPPAAPMGMRGKQIRDGKRRAPSCLLAAARNNGPACFDFPSAEGYAAFLIIWGCEPQGVRLTVPME